MWSIIREIFIYSCFLSLLYIVTYSNHQSNSFLQVNHLRKYFLNSRQINCDYTKVSLSSKSFHLQQRCPWRGRRGSGRFFLGVQCKNACFWTEIQCAKVQNQETRLDMSGTSRFQSQSRSQRDRDHLVHLQTRRILSISNNRSSPKQSH